MQEAIEPKRFLKRYIYVNSEIDRKLDEITRLRERSTKITQTFSSDRVQTSPSGDGTQNISVKIIMLENLINDDIDKLLIIKTEIENAIKLIDDDTYKLLLHFKYIDNCSWEEVSVKLNYSYFHVTHRLHPAALNQIKMHLNAPIEK